MQRLAWVVNYGVSAAIHTSTSVPAILVRMAEPGGPVRMDGRADVASTHSAAFRAFHSYPLEDPDNFRASIGRKFFKLALIA